MQPVEEEFQSFKEHMLKNGEIGELLAKDPDAMKFVHAVFFTGAFVAATLVRRFSGVDSLDKLAQLFMELDEFHLMAMDVTLKSMQAPAGTTIN